MPAVANVTLLDTFDQWRIKTNQLIAYTDQTHSVAVYASDLSNLSVAYANSIGNNSNAFAMSYANLSFTTIANGVAAFNQANASLTLASAAFDQANDVTKIYAYANNISNTSNSYANSIGIISNTYAMVYANSYGDVLRAYANNVGNTSNVYGMSYANTILTLGYAYSNTLSNTSNSYANSIGAASNNYANLTFYTAANGAVVFRAANNTANVTNSAFSAANNAVPAFLAANNASNTAVGAFTKANTSVQNNTTTKITVGYTIGSFNAGSNIASYGTWTPNAANGNYQFANSNGAVTIAAPANDSAIDILWTNGSAAGTVTFSGYQAPTGGGGDTYGTTSDDKYLLMIRRINSISTYVWKALQ